MCILPKKSEFAKIDVYLNIILLAQKVVVGKIPPHHGRVGMTILKYAYKHLWRT